MFPLLLACVVSAQPSREDDPIPVDTGPVDVDVHADSGELDWSGDAECGVWGEANAAGCGWAWIEAGDDQAKLMLGLDLPRDHVDEGHDWTYTLDVRGPASVVYLVKDGGTEGYTWMGCGDAASGGSGTPWQGVSGTVTVEADYVCEYDDYCAGPQYVYDARVALSGVVVQRSDGDRQLLADTTLSVILGIASCD